MWLSINERDSRPIYLQIINQVKDQVRRGLLKPGDELPSVRELADSLQINMHTVRGAYLKLKDQGLIELHLGRRATIAGSRFPLKLEDAEAGLQLRLEEVFTDALLEGLSASDISRIVDRQIEQIKKTER